MNHDRRRRANHSLRTMTRADKEARAQRKTERGERNGYSAGRRQRYRQSLWFLAEEARHES